jgi:membrane protease YdiL (CAAX protease family)
MSTQESTNIASQDPSGKSLPRVWTVFVVYLAALVGAIAGQIAAGMALAVWLLLRGTPPNELQAQLSALVTEPWVFLAIAGLSQLTIGLGAIIPAWLSPEPAFVRLGLVKPALPAWGYPIILVGTLVPFALALGSVYLVAKLVPSISGAEELYQKMTLAVAVPWVLFIAIVPGFNEELLFRGYIQRRLLARWRPPLAILVTSLLFAVMHIDPQHVALALILGVWLGMLAWRTGSVWPGILCHAFVNGAWNIYQLGVRLGDWPESPPVPVLVAASCLAIVCFGLSIWILARTVIGRKDEGDAVFVLPDSAGVS